MQSDKTKKAAEQSEKLDHLDRALLEIIQSAFPLDPRPYKVLAEKLGVTETDAYERVQAMRKSGLIRRLGANFQSAKLGFVSTLCAAKVPREKLNSFIERVNAEPGVTHNYEREHSYNVWFTLISPSREAEQKTLANISADTAIEILNLPATKLYKIKVDFPMEKN